MKLGRIVLAFLFAFFFFLGCISPPLRPPNPPEDNLTGGTLAAEQVYSQKCSKYSSGEQEQCFLIAGISQKSAKLCEAANTSMVGENSEIYKCYLEVLFANPEESTCAKLAGVSRDAEMAKSACYFVLAAKQQEPSYCSKITKYTGDVSKESCEMVANYDKNKCNDYPEIKGAREVCLTGVALMRSDPRYCDGINDEEMKMTCKSAAAAYTRNADYCPAGIDDCYLKVAIRTLDNSVCDRIEDGRIAGSCTIKLNLFD